MAQLFAKLVALARLAGDGGVIVERRQVNSRCRLLHGRCEMVNKEKEKKKEETKDAS